MLQTRWRKLLLPLFGHGRRPLPQRERRARPRLEALEDRAVPATLTVTSAQDSGAGSLRAILGAAHDGDTIQFDNKLRGATIRLTSAQLDVTHSVTIKGFGQNQLTVSGEDARRVFAVGSGVTATIAGLTVAHGKSDVGGGIDNQGTLTARDVLFTDNTTAGGLGGGAIYNETGATLTVLGSSFTRNRATRNADGDVLGGAILNQGTANVSGSSFTANEATGGAAADALSGSAGGAIDNFSGATLTVTNSRFSANRAVAAGGFFGMGGAIDNNAGVNGDTGSKATITNCVFDANVATALAGGGYGQGGAIISQGSGVDVTLTNCIITNNRALASDGGDGVVTLAQGQGGGVLNAVGTMQMRNCIVAGNEAGGGNGATITADNPKTGGGLGGGIANAFFGTLDMTACLVLGNVARGGTTTSGPGGSALGGGINNIFTATLTMTNCQVIGNQAIAGKGGPGASTVPAGLATGGGIETEFVSTVTITNCLIAANAAIGGAGGAGNRGNDALGGGISAGFNAYIGATFPEDTKVTIVNSLIVGNTATGGAGGSGANGGDGLGGGIWMFSRSDTSTSVTLQNTTVAGNAALGGARGTGGSAGRGIGGGLYNLGGAFAADILSAIRGNFASTSNKDVFSSP